jgi:hypothetical protein
LQRKFFPAKFLLCILEKEIYAGKKLLSKWVFFLIKLSSLSSISKF